MKKVLISIILASVATVSFAETRNEYNYRNFQNQTRNYELRHSHRNYYQQVNGGIAGAIIVRESQPVYVKPAPVYIQQPVYVPLPVVQSTACSGWRAIQAPDGRIYRERSCYSQ